MLSCASYADWAPMIETLLASHEPGAGRYIYVVDDDDAFRGSLEALLVGSGWTVQSFPSGREFLNHCSQLKPGLLLLDLHMPGESGLELLESRTTDLEPFSVVMMTGAGEVPSAVRSMKAGALDFVEKPFLSDELLEKLDHVHVAHKVTLRERFERADARRRIASLSRRELDVLTFLLKGFSNKAIARELRLSHRTVEMHRARMLQRLQVNTTAEAINIARAADLQGAIVPLTVGAETLTSAGR